MKVLKIYCCFSSLMISIYSFGQASYQEKQTTVSNIKMTVSNLGLTGNCFKGSYSALGYSSCEYPVNSGIENLFEGGLWIGAYVNGQPQVSTGAVDDATGYSTGKAGFEFTAPVGTHLNERSKFYNNPSYNPQAVSHQDFVADFTDSNILVPGTSILIQGHNPMDISGHFESYNWNYSFADFFVILRFTIKNSGSYNLDSLHFGYWADPVVRNVTITPPGGSAFFNKGGSGYVDSLALAYAFDAIGDTSFTRNYFSLMYLGAEDQYGVHHPSVDNTRVNYNVWQFNNASDPVYFSPGNDNSRFAKLSLGLNNNPSLNWTTVKNTIKQAGNRATLISAGPYKTLKPGESIDVVFAVVCAKVFEDGRPVTSDTDLQKTNLVQNAYWAQRTYNGEDKNFNGKLDVGEDLNHDNKITRYILPSPPDIPYTKVVASDNKIDVYFSNNSENSVDPISNKMDFEGYRIYMSTMGFDVQTVPDALSSLKLLAEFDIKDSLFYNTGLEAIKINPPATFENDTSKYFYKYTINNVPNGWQQVIAVTSFDMGNKESNLESLESSKLASMVRVFPGKTANADMKANEPFVYPNPYYQSAIWEGPSKFAEDKKIIFSNLPANCIINIYSPAGDLIKVIKHNGQYNGSDSRWFSTYSDPSNSKFSGGEHAWDMLSSDDQIIARGLYVFTVEDSDSGKTSTGKFVIIK